MSITSADPEWTTTLNVRCAPRHGESLLSYLLWLDDLNGVEPGYVAGLIRRSSAGIGSLASPGKMLTGYVFDLAQLAREVALPMNTLAGLSVGPVLRWLSGDQTPKPTYGYFGQRQQFALCPACIRDRVIPIAFLFAFMRSCPEHGLLLVEQCGGEPSGLHDFTFFDGDLYRCSDLDCLRYYQDLPQRLADRETVREDGARTRVLNDLIEIVRNAPPIGEYSASLRALAQRGGISSSVQLALQQPRPPIASVVEVLGVTGVSVADWLEAGPSDRGGLPAREAPPLFVGEPRCPQCGAERVHRRGLIGSARRREASYMCKECGTRFTRTRVLFSFAPHPRYSPVRAARNGRRIQELRLRLTAVLRTWPAGDRVTLSEAFARAGIPDTLSYRAPRAGLRPLVDAHLSTKTEGPAALTQVTKRGVGRSLRTRPVAVRISASQIAKETSQRSIGFGRVFPGNGLQRLSQSHNNSRRFVQGPPLMGEDRLNVQLPCWLRLELDAQAGRRMVGTDLAKKAFEERASSLRQSVAPRESVVVLDEDALRFDNGACSLSRSARRGSPCAVPRARRPSRPGPRSRRVCSRPLQRHRLNTGTTKRSIRVWARASVPFGT